MQDIAISSTALIVCSPLLALVALAILYDDGRPILFRQKRIGRNGRTFDVLKFRKFRAVGSVQGSMLTLLSDDRYSRVGRILERTKLNELPQLVNVLRGDMSIVGPRPEIVEFAHCFSGQRAALLDHRPGIFGPSQSAFRNEAAMYPADVDAVTFYETRLFPAKADLDLAYYPVATTGSDLAWIVRSLVAVIRPARAAAESLITPFA